MRIPTEIVRRRVLRAGLLGLLVLLAGLPAAAQPARGDEELRADVHARFEVLPLRSGVLLRPLDSGAGYRAVEITGAGVAVDGDLLDGDELEDRLGAEGDLVRRLARRDPDELAGLLGDAAAAPPPAEESDLEATREEERESRSRHRRVRSDSRVSVGSSITIEADEEARDVVVIGGSLDVLGEVLGDAVAVGGSVEVEGRVTGDVVAVGGGLRLGPEAEILGDAVSVGGRVDRDPGARVSGKVSEVAFSHAVDLGWLRWLDRHHDDFDFDEDRSPWQRVNDAAWRVVGVVVLGLLACLAFLVARGPIERMEAKVEQEAWKAGLTGLVAQILFVPLLVLVIFVLVVSFVGIPLLVLVPFALLALLVGAFAGYTAVAYRLGRWSESRFGWQLGSPYLVLALGVALIQVWTLVGRALDLGGGPLKVFSFLIVFVGLLVQYLAWTVGFGAFMLTRFGTQSSWYPRRGALPAPPPPAAPPPPPLPEEPGAVGEAAQPEGDEPV